MNTLKIYFVCLCILTFVPTLTFAETPEEMFETRCAVCHSINPPPKLAPPFRGIVRHYTDTYPERDAFAKAVADFVVGEKEREVLLPGAVQHFGEMPEFPYKKEELVTLAGWIWDSTRGQYRGGKSEQDCK